MCIRDSSTGARCEETSRVNIEDVNGDEVRLFGKGNKERVAYLNARAQMLSLIHI